MSTDREEKIRQRAYELWERDGAQHGRDQDYWHEAVEQIDAEENAEKAPKSAPARKRKAAAEKPAAKKAAAKTTTRGGAKKDDAQDEAAERARAAAQAAAKAHGYDLSDAMKPEPAPKKRAPRKPKADKK